MPLSAEEIWLLFSTAMATMFLFSAPRPLFLELLPPIYVSSTSTIPHRFSLPGRNIARLTYADISMRYDSFLASKLFEAPTHWHRISDW